MPRNWRKNKPDIFVHFRGMDRSLREISEITGISYHTLWRRYTKYGTNLEEPLYTHLRLKPNRKGKRLN